MGQHLGKSLAQVGRVELDTARTLKRPIRHDLVNDGRGVPALADRFFHPPAQGTSARRFDSNSFSTAASCADIPTLRTWPFFGVLISPRDKFRCTSMNPPLESISPAISAMSSHCRNPARHVHSNSEYRFDVFIKAVLSMIRISSRLGESIFFLESSFACLFSLPIRALGLVRAASSIA
jgi:hypothetical protein